ncbi:MAG TPA: FAD:protein FMN transferase [Pseudonocardiaceae bacterium]|nr:FAD:protein FMN transferase [Pseudonocardiaceae bacterium]
MTALRAGDRVSFPALGGTATLVVSDPGRLAEAEQILRGWLVAIDAACSRFRPDSEISWLHEHAGAAVKVSPLLFDAVSAALRGGLLTAGLVDPTVGQAVLDLGYDRDFPDLGPAPAVAHRPAPGWWRVQLGDGTVLLPRDIRLDLGATAKAFAADRAASLAAAATGCGVLVNLGGDISTAGPAPEGGWRIGVAHDHRSAVAEVTVTIQSGGLATSSTSVRAWRQGGRAVHHIVDPRTGDIPPRVWRTVSVAARSCVDANIASTAAIVLGLAAPGWLRERQLPARLCAEPDDLDSVGVDDSPAGDGDSDDRAGHERGEGGRGRNGHRVNGAGQGDGASRIGLEVAGLGEIGGPGGAAGGIDPEGVGPAESGLGRNDSGGAGVVPRGSGDGVEDLSGLEAAASAEGGVDGATEDAELGATAAGDRAAGGAGSSGAASNQSRPKEAAKPGPPKVVTVAGWPADGVFKVSR